jgi:molybdopterin molybdotransferase
MMEELTARHRILAAMPLLPAVELPLAEALGHHLAVDCLATVPVPAFDNSAMDGYALHGADCGQSNHVVEICGEQPAGADRQHSVQPGRAVRIFTGAPLPSETAAVLMQEDATVLDGRTIRIDDAAQPGEFIRRKGADLCEGQKIGDRGAKLTALRLGLLASQGLADVRVIRRPRIAILSTGTELRKAGETLRSGEIYDSNGTLLSTLLVESIGPLSITLASGADDFTVLSEIIQSLAQTHDALIIAGGVSVGDHDLVRPVLADLGATLDFWKVRVKPGKPFLFGTCGNAQIFGLPGNPVSAYVTALLFVLPALRKMAGAPETCCGPNFVPMQVAAALENRDQRPSYVRGIFDAASRTFQPAGLQESHALASLSRANALLRVDSGHRLEHGETAEGILIG